MMRRVLLLASWLALPACAAIWGFEEGQLGADSNVDVDTPGTVDGAALDGGLDLDATSETAPPNCSERVADPKDTLSTT